MPLSKRPPRSGFTIVEIVVALTISAIVLLGARALLQQLADSADLTTESATESNRRANTARAVRDLVKRAEPSDSAKPFTGNTSRAHFTSWCDTPAGWVETCAVTVSADSSATIVKTSKSDSLIVAKGATQLRYLTSAANGGEWAKSWQAGLTTPLAVGVITSNDTIVLRIGERR